MQMTNMERIKARVLYDGNIWADTILSSYLTSLMITKVGLSATIIAGFSPYRLDWSWHHWQQHASG